MRPIRPSPSNLAERTIRGLLCVIAVLLACTPVGLAQSDPLPSWTEGASKRSIMEFVRRTTQKGGPDFDPDSERIATFDNDGTLWIEQPLYVQLRFALDRTKALAPEHPEWKTTQPFKAALENDYKTLGES